MLGHAVVGDQGVLEGTKHAPLKGPRVEDQRGMCCCLPTLTTWGRSVKKSRIQLQREVFSPRVLSLVMSFFFRFSRCYCGFSKMLVYSNFDCAVISNK